MFFGVSQHSLLLENSYEGIWMTKEASQASYCRSRLRESIFMFILFVFTLCGGWVVPLPSEACNRLGMSAAEHLDWK